VLSVTLPTGSPKLVVVGGRNRGGGCGEVGKCFVRSPEPISFDKLRTNMTSISATITNVNIIKNPTSSTGNPASLRRTSEPPSIIPKPTMPMDVMAVRKAVMA
jgi:hypothetical protein